MVVKYPVKGAEMIFRGAKRGVKMILRGAKVVVS